MKTVAYTDKRVHPASAPFYTMFPWEQMRSGEEIKVDLVVGVIDLKMEWLLEQIPAKVDARGNLFIIHHGTDMGLSMPLATGTAVHADVRIMEVLDSSRTDVEAARICQFHNPQGNGARRVHSLRGKIRRVKDLRINCVELRACNIGKNVTNMQIIKRFFNCQSLGAPNLRDSYFFLDPGRVTTNTQTWQHWQQSHPRHRIFDVSADGRVGIAIREAAHSAFRTFMIVNKDYAPNFWATAYLSILNGHEVGSMRRFPGHALYDTEGTFPLIFPGDDAYTQHIIHV